MNPLGRKCLFLELFQIIIFMVMTGRTGIGNIRVVDRILWYQDLHHMAVNVPGFRALGNPRHVAPDAVGKRVDGMGSGLVEDHMAFKALLRPRSDGLGAGRGHTQLVYILARCTRHTLLRMNR